MPRGAWSQPERPVEWRNPIRVDGEFYGPRLAGNAANESPLFEPDHHRIHRWGREIEEPLEIGMAGATPASFRIMYSRMKARNCPCWRVGPPAGGAADDSFAGAAESNPRDGCADGLDSDSMATPASNDLRHHGFVFPQRTARTTSPRRQLAQLAPLASAIAWLSLRTSASASGFMWTYNVNEPSWPLPPALKLILRLKIARPVKRRRLSNRRITGNCRSNLRGSSQTKWLTSPLDTPDIGRYAYLITSSLSHALARFWSVSARMAGPRRRVSILP